MPAAQAMRSAWRQWRWPGRAGLIATVTVLGVALLGPVVAPYGLATPIGAPFAPPGDGSPLGTDFLGRDVLSRLLWGGRSIVLIAVAAMVLAYASGMALGLIAGLSRSGRDGLLLRPVDLLLALPPFLVLAVLATGGGRGVTVLILAGAFANLPFITRYTRAATLDVSVKGYVEAAVMRGEGKVWVAAREVLPNIAATLLADAGVRFIGAVYLVASANFLGLGLQPPTGP
ncbi:MAG: ABC transporter permease [Egibacteraceae bacterium]